MEHECDKRVDDRGIIFYDEKNNSWWFELGFDSAGIRFCPFCGINLWKLPSSVQCVRCGKCLKSTEIVERHCEECYEIVQDKILSNLDVDSAGR